MNPLSVPQLLPTSLTVYNIRNCLTGLGEHVQQFKTLWDRKRKKLSLLSSRGSQKTAHLFSGSAAFDLVWMLPLLPPICTLHKQQDLMVDSGSSAVNLNCEALNLETARGAATPRTLVSWNRSPFAH